MDNNALIEQIVNQVLGKMTANSGSAKPACEVKKSSDTLTEADYPISKKRSDLIKTRSGKSFDDINMENVLNGSITLDDIKITPEVLLYQAQIAESVGRTQFAANLRRAAELTFLPDDRVLEIYNALRPYRSTKQELLDIASELENKYNAKLNAQLVREAADIYEKRNRLKA